MIRVDAGALHTFIAKALTSRGVDTADARTVADILLAADLRGVESHGAARLRSHYLNRIANGVLDVSPVVRIERDMPTTMSIDAGNGLGHPVAKRAMQHAIDKARQRDIGIVAVRNSNHFGIAGYYAMMALQHDMIGIASTNALRGVAPTFGSDAMLGTNPLAIAIPAASEEPYVLDFATSAVARGKLEIAVRKGGTMPLGWAVDAGGNPTTDPVAGLAGALLPLGGSGVENGGHKGFGLGVLVDILCAVLSGGTFGAAIPASLGPMEPGPISHWFMAMRVGALRDIEEFKRDVDTELRAFKASAPVPGQTRVYVPGELEFESERDARRNGVQVRETVFAELQAIGTELGIEPPAAR